jgi:hypothetical protein
MKRSVYKGGRYSAVGTATCYGLDDLGIECRWQDRRGGKPRILVLLGGKRPARGADHPLPSSAALRKVWYYRSVIVDLEA